MSIPTNATLLQLQFQQYAGSFHDAPKNFTPPAYLDPNYVPPRRDAPLTVFTIICLVVMPMIVGTRLYVRLVLQKRFGLDDWLIIPALMVSMACAINVVIMPRDGVGKHAYDLSVLELEIVERYKYVEIITYYTAVFFTKLSIVAFLYRMIQQAFTPMRMLLHVTAVFYTVLYIISVLFYTLSCQPISAIWTIALRIQPTTHCWNIDRLITAVGWIYAAGDIWLLMLPMPQIWGLKVPLKNKLGIIFIMSFGLIACVGSVVKVVTIGGLYDSWDPTWNCYPTLWGATIELSAGIVAACLPSFAVLAFGSIANRVSKILSSFSGRRAHSGRPEKLASSQSDTQSTTQKSWAMRMIPSFLGPSPHRIPTLNLTRVEIGMGTVLGKEAHDSNRELVELRTIRTKPEPILPSLSRESTEYGQDSARPSSDIVGYAV